MRVSVDLPDPPRIEPLLESLSRQYQDVVQALLRLQSEAQREDRYAPILTAMQAQQDALVMAFERMMAMMHQGKEEDRHSMQEMMRQEVAAPQQQASEALVSAIRGVKRTLSGLPEDLGSAMSKQWKQRQQAMTKEAPKAPAPRPEASNRIVAKLDQMESALVGAMKKSRNRTFGSNY